MSGNKSIAKHVIAAIAFAVLLAAPVAAYAHGDESTTSGERGGIMGNKEKVAEVRSSLASKAAEIKDRKNEIASKTAELKEDRCKLIGERIDLNVTRFEESRNEHVSNYQNAKKRTEELIARLKKDGLDTKKLEADLVQLDTLIKQFATDYAAYITALKGAKTYECGNSQGQFKTAVEQARALLLKSKQSALAVRNYYQNTIRPDIMALKAQRKASGSPKASATASASPRVSASPEASSSAQ